MKIISKEDFKNNIDYTLKQDLLIPCFVYRIPIETSKNKTLNFIEETILKLIQLDSSLKNDIKRLSKMIGFYSDIEKEDKTKIVQLIVNKLKDLRIDNDREEDNSEVIIYQFYQEAYTNELLPIVTQEINDFSFMEREYKFEDSDAYKVILFKQQIGSKRGTKAILSYKYNKQFYKPTRTDIIKTIYTHNQSKYKESHTIDYKNFKIDMIDKPELIYLHTKLFIPKNNIQSFVITNGFTNDFSTILRKVFEYKHQELLQILRKNTKSDLEKKKDCDVDIPFENSINRYSEVKSLIKTIERESLKLSDVEGTEYEVIKSKDILIQSLYDLIEKSFAIFTKDLIANKSIQDKKLLKTLAKDFGFNIDGDKRLAIFGVDSRENLQKYIAKSLVYKKDELYDISSIFPNLFFSLNNLLNLRNGVKHSDKKETLKKVNVENLEQYKYTIYKVVSVVLKIKQQAVSTNEVDNDDSAYIQNAYIELEEQISIDVLNKLPQELKDNLISINFYLDGMDFDTNKYNIVKEVINTLYSSFEYIVRNIINTLALEDQDTLTKDEIITKIREDFEIGESLYRVSPKMIENALNKQNASLGAYMLVYLYHQNKIDENDVKLVEMVLTVRGHGSPSMEDVEKITKKKLVELKRRSFIYIEKLMREI